MSRDGKVMVINDHPEAWKTKDSAKIYEIKAVGGYTVYCTEEHPIATDNGWVPASQLKNQDKVLVLDKWDKFGDGIVPLKDTFFTLNDDLAELVGWLTANIKSSEDVKITCNHDRVHQLVTKYFPATPIVYTSSSITVTIVGTLKTFLKQVIQYDSNGVPYGINYFTKSQLIRFFYPLFFTNGQAYKKLESVKIHLKGNNTPLRFYREHLNKLGLHGSFEAPSNSRLVFACSTNYYRFKEIFSEYLPKDFIPPFYSYRPRGNPQIILGPDGEELKYSFVRSIKKLDKESPVWDTTIPDKGWFLCSGVKVSNSGKTNSVAMIVAACMIILPSMAEKFPEDYGLFKNGLWVGCFGPVGEQAVTMFDRVYDMLTTDSARLLLTQEMKLPIPAKGGARGNIIRLGNKSYIRYQSGNKRAKVESKTYHLILLDECVSGDTEVLTTNGWIRIDSWNGQEVAVLNKNFEVIYEVPKRYIQHDNVPLITAKCKRGLDYTTTAGHNIIYTPAKNPLTIKNMLACDFWERGNVGSRAIRSGTLKDTYKLSYYDRVGVMLNADGCKYNTKKNGDIVWKLEFSKKRKINRCKYLLKKAGIEYRILGTREFDNPNWNDSTKIVFTLGDKDYKEPFSNWLPYNCGEDFIKELLHWDGHRCKKTREYDSIDRNNVEFAEQVCVHSNINCSPIRTIERENKKHSTSYRLDMYQKHGFSFGRNSKELEINNDSAYCFETSTGMFFIRKNGIVLVTGNCQDMESFKIQKGILPSGSATNATVIATGTPDVYVGYFYDTIEQNKSEDLKRAPSAQRHFEADYTVAQKYNTMYKKFVQNEIKRYNGIEADEFKMAYRLIWPITKGMVFTKTQLEEFCYNKSLRFIQEYKETPCIAGLDLGKSQDSTVITVIRPFWEEADENGNMPKQILNWMELEGDEWELQYPKIVDFLSNYNIDTLVCDSTGVGDPVRERLAIMMPSISVIPFIFSPSTKDKGYKYLIQEVNAKRLIIPAHHRVRETSRFKKFEHQAITLKKHYSGKFLNPCPIDTSKGHDDFIDATMLAVFGTYYDVMPEIEEDSNDIFIPTRDNIENLFGKSYSRPRRR